MKVALHGLETFIVRELTRRTGKSSRKVSPTVIRYADDFVVLDEELPIIEQAKDIISAWLKDMGLELKPSKTHITHTLEPCQEMVGVDFLGWTVRQFPVGKTHTGTDRWGNALGFKTIITPSKEAVKRHIHEVKVLIRKNSHAPQGQLIKELNQVIHGWTNYYRSMVATETFHHCRFILCATTPKLGQTSSPTQRYVLGLEQILACGRRERMDLQRSKIFLVGT